MDDLRAFLEVAERESFSKAAKKIGLTPSSLSHTIKKLEERLGVRLLARTTRNVSPTEAGERLIRSIGPLYEQISIEIDRLGEFRDRPAGTIRITASGDAIQVTVLPMLREFLAEYPDIKLEVMVDNGFSDIISERYDAGIRLGEAVSKDMIAVRIGPDWRLSVVGSPTYFSSNPKPLTPKELVNHNCINIRHSKSSGLYVWEFEKDGKQQNVKVEGQYVTNNSMQALDAALNGVGLAIIPDYLAKSHLNQGMLVEVLEDWCPSFSGYHLYYANRRQSSPAFQAFVKALRYKS